MKLSSENVESEIRNRKMPTSCTRKDSEAMQNVERERAAAAACLRNSRHPSHRNSGQRRSAGGEPHGLRPPEGHSATAFTVGESPTIPHHQRTEIGWSLAMADSRAISSTLSARLKTATPPIQPVKPTLRELWITRPMVKGPPFPAAGV